MLPSYIAAGKGHIPLSPRIQDKLKILEALRPPKKENRGSRRRFLLSLFIISMTAYVIGANIVAPLLSEHLSTIHIELHTSTTRVNGGNNELTTSNLYVASNFSTPTSLQLLRESGDALFHLDQMAQAAARAAKYSKEGLNAAFLISNTEDDDMPSATTIAKMALKLPLPAEVPKKRNRPINELYKEVCPPPAHLADKIAYSPPNVSSERLLSSRSWVRRYGNSTDFHHWCRAAPLSMLPDLRPAVVYKSEKERPAPGLTVVTQLSLERLGMLENQCKFWPNQIAAVLYIPLQRGKIFSAEEPDLWHMRPLHTGLRAISKLYKAAEADPNGCVLDLEVVVEERCFREAATLYPANAVRNRALMLAETDIVLLLDADFVVSNTLANVAADAVAYSEMLDVLEQGAAMVIPAFEAWDSGEQGRLIATESVKQGKEYIVDAYHSNLVMGFHMAHYHQGHGKTDHSRWANTTEAYQINYQIGFEPYVLMARKLVPWYDERFRGYYWNKVCHLMHIAFQHRFRFIVYPEAFVVHVPHKTPPTKWRTRASGQKEKNYALFSEAITDMKRGRFVPVTSFAHVCVPRSIAAAAVAAVVDGKLGSLALIKKSVEEEGMHEVMLDPKQVAEELERSLEVVQ